MKNKILEIILDLLFGAIFPWDVNTSVMKSILWEEFPVSLQLLFSDQLLLLFKDINRNNI